MPLRTPPLALWAALALPLTSPSSLLAEDLILVGTELTLDGDHSFELVSLSGGATLRVAGRGEGGSGALYLECDTLTVDSASAIKADGAGFQALKGGQGLGSDPGPGPGAAGLGGGGGGHGGAGGAGGSVGGDLGGAGGISYGEEVSALGSPGGEGVGEGGQRHEPGAGGGFVMLKAGTVLIAGSISAGGVDGEGLGGGGSGGTVHIIGADVTLRGTLAVSGGDGGVEGGVGGGGGGGGGILKVELEEGDFALATLDRRGGAGQSGAMDGSEGRVSVTIADFDGDGYNSLEGDCEPTNPEVGPGAVEVLDGKDSDCDGRIDEGTDVYDDDGDGVSENSGDCDDDNPLISPGAPELEDGQDNDCDGQIDEDALTPSPGLSPTPSATGSQSPSPSISPETYPIDDGALVEIIEDPRSGCACSAGEAGEGGSEGLAWLMLLFLAYPGPSRGASRQRPLGGQNRPFE